MRQICYFFVIGLPATQGSKQFVTRYYARDSCKRLPAWRKNVGTCARQWYKGDPLLCPIYLDLEFMLPRPKSHCRTGMYSDVLKDTAPARHIVKPDLIKMARAVEDAMSGIVYKDDSQVFDYVGLKKRYADIGEDVGVNVTVLVEDIDI